MITIPRQFLIKVQLLYAKIQQAKLLNVNYNLIRQDYAIISDGQFIFTTHNVLHLNLRKQMKEQIYFVTKDLSTLHFELYSLADFSDIYYDSE